MMIMSLSSTAAEAARERGTVVRTEKVRVDTKTKRPTNRKDKEINMMFSAGQERKLKSEWLSVSQSI